MTTTSSITSIPPTTARPRTLHQRHPANYIMWPRSNDYTRAVRRSVSARAQHIRCDDHGTDAFRGGYTLTVVLAVRGGGGGGDGVRDDCHGSRDR